MAMPHDEVERAARVALKGRYDQAFPTLTAEEIGRLRRFGAPRHYRDGEPLLEAGKAASGMSIILRGHVAVTARDGLGQVTPVVEHGPGGFLAEVASLSDHAGALVDGHAEGDVDTILIPPEGLRALLIAEAELGERIMRALVLRRVNLITGGRAGPVLIGTPSSGDVIRLRGFLTRNSYPHHVLEPPLDPAAAAVVASVAPGPRDWPVVVCPNGAVLRNPREVELARELGMIGDLSADRLFDVAVVGSGPAGLATAVYAASEGLSVVVLDGRAFGGQAGASARIENYFGFPTGISGQALTARAYVQARKFGAEILIPVEVTGLDCSRADGALGLMLDGGQRLRARAVVIASGARYRRPAIENLGAFEGRGVWYWASPIEGAMCKDQDVVLVGGGNSAGQAAVYLAGSAARVRMMVRGDGLADSMSRYLIDRIRAAPNIELMTRTEVVALDGSDTGLERVTWRDHRAGTEAAAAIRNMFLFVGADPATAWLASCGVTLDQTGFVITGATSDLRTGRAAAPLESTVPGVFAVGDVRAGSVKRVGGAIGEGAQVVAALHAFLSDEPSPESRT
ncbi:MAG: FAD-dependent oxidoreductase [Deltaproteobacteria bacterium]|nr:FAD-dependent oxidoreductase [Deltaproteobacteria bacterium]